MKEPPCPPKDLDCFCIKHPEHWKCANNVPIHNESYDIILILIILIFVLIKNKLNKLKTND